MRVRGGYTNYGEAVGILMLDTRFPRVPGDIGNARTFDFPVRYLTVQDASAARVVEQRDPSLLEPFIRGARELQAQGVKAITTSCGFLAIFQKQLASAVEVPVFASSLLQVPFLYGLFGRKGTAGILTARKAALGQAHFDGCDIQGIPLSIAGMDEHPEFTRVFLHWGEGGQEPMELERVEQELAAAAAGLAARDPEVRFLVLECTNMPPFRRAIQQACGLPVYDIVTLTRFVHSGLLETPPR